MMRLYILSVVVVVLSLASCSEKENEGNEIKSNTVMSPDQYFQSTNFDKYIGLTVGDLLHDIPFKPEELIGFDEPPGKLRGIRYGFEGGYKVYVATRSLRYTDEFDENRRWNFDNFKKERISGVAIRRFGPDPYLKIFGEVKFFTK